MNISGFRRAFAYAFDKTKVTAEFADGLFSVHDSIVPITSEFCIEDELDWNYFTNRTDIGNQILDELGFEINSTTGWRDAPNGEPFTIEFSAKSYSPPSFWPSYLLIVRSIANAAAEALNTLHIYTSYPGIYVGGFYPQHRADMYIHDTYFSGNNIDWLGHDQPFISFTNATFETTLENLLSGTSYDAVFEAGAEIQRILHYNVPRLVVCSGLLIQPYRTDSFTKMIEDISRGISGIWSLCNMHSNSGSPGGTIRIGFLQNLRNLNIYTVDSPKARALLETILPTLYTLGPNLELIPNLATSMISETHADNSAIPEGHTRITVDILSNATWSDGEPLTAVDVAYTVTYEYMSGTYGNPAAQELRDLLTAYAPTSTRVIFEYDTESYWHQFDRATRFIIPKHIFNDLDGIGYEEWNTWNPVFDSDEPLMTCGPFVIDYDSVIIDKWNKLIELEMTRNPNYYYTARNLPENETETQSPTTPGTQYPLNRFLIGFYASTMVWVMIILIIEYRRTPHNL